MCVLMSPSRNVCGEESCVTILKTAARETNVTEATGNVACVIFCTKMWELCPRLKFGVCPP